MKPNYEELYENAPIGYVTVGLDGKIMACNRTFCTMLGAEYTNRSCNAMIGRKVLSLYTDDEYGLDVALRVFSEFQEGRTVRDVEASMLRSDGSRIWVSLTVQPVIRDGRVLRSRSVVLDISARKAVEQERDYLRLVSETFFEMAQLFVLVLDQNGRVIRLNPYGCKRLGYPSEELFGVDWLNTIVPAIDQERIKVVFDQTLTQRTEGVTNLLQTARGEMLVVTWYNMPLRDDRLNTHGILSVGLDITERVEMERARTETVQNLAHELRTPLTLIRGYAELLREGELDADQVRNALSIVLGRVMALERISNRVVTLWRYQAGDGLAEITDLSWVAGEMCYQSQGLAQAHGIDLSCDRPDTPAWVSGSDDDWREVVDNLIGNAIKFTEVGGEIRLRVRCVDDQVILTVSDTGIGIEQDHLERVFQRFYQVNGSETRRYGGMGLGLAVVKEVIESLGGEIEVVSRVGEGTTFTIRMPMKEADHDHEQT